MKKYLLLALFLAFGFAKCQADGFSPAFLFAFQNESQSVAGDSPVAFSQLPRSVRITQVSPTLFQFEENGKYLVKYKVTGSVTGPFYVLRINGQDVQGTSQNVFQGSAPAFIAPVAGRAILRVNQGDQLSLVNLGLDDPDVTLARLVVTRIAPNH